MIQLELIGENLRNHISVTTRLTDVLSAFQVLLDRLVQSNMSGIMDASLELTVQVVWNLRDGKREAEKKYRQENLN